MKIRKLQLKDAPFMLEWMHDNSIVCFLQKKFSDKTVDDCRAFIDQAQNESENVHLAITDDDDRYMGTVSLKNINDNSAELGIVVRSCAIGKGYAAFGLREVFEYGFKERGLDLIYWCVDPRNKRALHFYNKNCCQRCDAPEQAIDYTEEERQRLIWYCYRKCTN